MCPDQGPAPQFRTQMGGFDCNVDYLQMIQLPEDQLHNTARAVGRWSCSCNLAAELDTTIILVSQISRSFASRQDKGLSSPTCVIQVILEIADGVIFLYRHAHTSAAARKGHRGRNGKDTRSS